MTFSFWFYLLRIKELPKSEHLAFVGARFLVHGDIEMDELIKNLFTPTSQIMLIMGMAEILKGCGVPNKYIPVADVAMGVCSGLVVFSFAFDYSIVEGLSIGIALGLSACGLFSGIKNTLE